MESPESSSYITLPYIRVLNIPDTPANAQILQRLHLLGVIVNALPYRGWTDYVDADDISWGIVYTGEHCSHLPEDYCYLLTMGNTKSGGFAQIAVGRTSSSIYYRTTTGTWKKISVTT